MRALNYKRLKSWERGLTDPPHPLDKPRRIGPDQSQIIPKKIDNDKEGAIIRYGYSANAELYTPRSTVVSSYGIGGVRITATLADLSSFSLTMGSGS